ncbi:hypothetical protein PsorP6_011266 [Peronosclerospora sorghi]|uniref:Uncharacterized protein n=1 Tax=Peronosclerospora sorghi TaxID=230839 RepID=A0ACC0WK70_9STRA|nr:hypothetical protein PsorP6_011266 [Peronosclerospora sorghi]
MFPVQRAQEFFVQRQEHRRLEATRLLHETDPLRVVHATFPCDDVRCHRRRRTRDERASAERRMTPADLEHKFQLVLIDGLKPLHFQSKYIHAS